MSLKMSATVSAKVPFISLCKLCEKISTKSKKDEKRVVLAKFIAKWRDFHSELHENNPNVVDSFYPAMRLILPHLERERGAYGIKETTLAKLYIEILTLAPESEDAKKLIHYRTPKNAKALVGDFASVAEMVLKKRCREEAGTLTVSDINEILDNIAAGNAENNKAGVKKNLRRLVCNLSPFEQKWAIRMIMKDLKMGMSEQTIFTIYHPDAKDLFNVTSSLSKVCMQLRNPNTRLHEIEIELFSPFRPMLAAQASPTEIPKLMDEKSFLIETKYDGERVQLHKKDNIFKYFSRSGLEYSQAYGETPTAGSLTPFIANCFRSDVKTCILDGEMVGWNKKLLCIGTKGQNFDVKNLLNDDEYQACFCVFDILLCNDQVLTNKPLVERLKHLDGLFSDLEGRIFRAPQAEGVSKEDVISHLNCAIDNREEGIIIKSPSSIYKPNTRGWVKVKPEYLSNVMSEMDLLILGGYFGEGRLRRGLISHFLLGVAVPPENKDENPYFFHSFTKVGTGYTLQELYQLLGKLKDSWQVYEKRRPPSNIILAPGHKEKPDVWIEPSKSQIVQVKAAEIINSERFKTECTLRFPRVEAVRYDKPWHQCMTVDDLTELRKKAEGKLAFKHVTDDNDDNLDAPSPKKRALVRKQEVKLAAQFAPADVTGVTKESSIFHGKEIYVISGPPSHPKDQLEQLIVKFGGIPVQNYGISTFCILSDKLNIKTKNLMKADRDIVKTAWFLKCVKNAKFIPWTPSDMWNSSEATAEKMLEKYDEFGDSYFTPVTAEELQIVFNNISDEVVEEKKLKSSDISELEFKYFTSYDYDLGLYRMCRIYIDDKLIVEDETTKVTNHPLETVELLLRYYGATITSSLNDSTTHIVTHSMDNSRLSMLKNLNKTEGGKMRSYIVTENWISDCIQEAKILNERHYYPLS